MFQAASNFSGEVSKWNTERVVDMSFMAVGQAHFEHHYRRGTPRGSRRTPCTLAVGGLLFRLRLRPKVGSLFAPRKVLFPGDQERFLLLLPVWVKRFLFRRAPSQCDAVHRHTHVWIALSPAVGLAPEKAEESQTPQERPGIQEEAALCEAEAVKL